MKKKIKIEVEMEERWVPYFNSFLCEMERLGKIGSSKTVSFYSDGDGDFRPIFNFSEHFELMKPNKNNVYDAG